ncbi:MAG: glycosyltransferase family A protein [Candidatus Uhrbacteria bacterium]
MKISIIIPCWNNSREVARCLDALAQQAFRDFEIVVIDDGSDPPIASQLSTANYQLPIRIIRQSHAGAPAARNLGARETSGEFIMFCDADVVLRPSALARLVVVLDSHPEASYVYPAFQFGWKTFRSFPFNAERLRRMPYIHTSALIRRIHFPGFDESLQRFQDWDLWLTMLEHGHVGIHVPEILYTIPNTHGTMSRWIPSFLYRIPWQRLGWMPQRIRSYRHAFARICAKHNLEII